jgi:hypothetical protein
MNTNNEYHTVIPRQGKHINRKVNALTGNYARRRIIFSIDRDALTGIAQNHPVRSII